MNSRARFILNMVSSTQETESDQPLSTQNIQYSPEPNIPKIFQPDALSDDFFDTNYTRQPTGPQLIIT